MKCHMTNLTRGIDGEYQLTISTRDKVVINLWDELHESEVNATMKKWHKKRSLDANAYFWTLADKLAEKLGTSKLEVYRECIRGIPGVSDVVCAQDRTVERLTREWKRQGLGWFTELEPSKIEGCTNVVFYYGSSSYDSKQMAALIDHIIEDCRAVDIETLPPHELAAMQEAWGAKKDKQ